MRVARHVDGGALALPLVADGGLALVVVLAVAARILVLSDSHGHLAESLLLLLPYLGSLIRWTFRITVFLLLQKLVNPCEFFVFVENEGAEERVLRDGGLFDIEA